jgi:hypothetical protein
MFMLVRMKDNKHTMLFLVWDTKPNWYLISNLNLLLLFFDFN